MTTKTTSTKRYIYKCQDKNCKHVYALDFDVTYYVETRQYSYKLVNAPEWAAAEVAQKPWMRMPRNFTQCSKCGRFAKMDIVKGFYNPEHVCDGCCMSAKGSTCDCSCGGANHGANWVR